MSFALHKIRLVDSNDGLGRFHVTYKVCGEPGDVVIVQSAEFPSAVVSVTGGTTTQTVQSVQPCRGPHLFNTSRMHEPNWKLTMTEPIAYVTYESLLRDGYQVFVGEDYSWMEQDCAEPYLTEYMARNENAATAPTCPDCSCVVPEQLV